MPTVNVTGTVTLPAFADATVTDPEYVPAASPDGFTVIPTLAGVVPCAAVAASHAPLFVLIETVKLVEPPFEALIATFSGAAFAAPSSVELNVSDNGFALIVMGALPPDRLLSVCPSESRAACTVAEFCDQFL